MAAKGPDRLEALRAGATGAQLVARIADVRFILDELARRGGETMAGGCRLGALDRDRIGMAGHSFGAVTTQALAGQRFPQGMIAVDHRIKAALAFSPSPSRQLPDAEAFGAITMPFLSVTGTADVVPMLDRTTAAERTRPFAAMPPGAKYLLVLDGADHAIFNGHRLRRAALPSDDRVKAAVVAVSSAFWQAHLLGMTDAATALRSPTGGYEGLLPTDRWSAN